MARLQAAGVSIELPQGWEGRLARRDPDPNAPAAVLRAAADGRAPVVLHAANFPLPPGLGDFGGGAVEAMRPPDLYVSLFEYGPESVGTALFAATAMPRELRQADVDPHTMRTPLPGMSGGQWFFTEAGRPFSLYVVLGSHLRRHRTLPLITSILRTVTVA